MQTDETIIYPRLSSKIYINSLLFAYKATNNISYLKQAKRLVEKMINGGRYE